MKSKEEILKNRFKSGNLLLFVIALCGMLTVCSNPASSGSSGGGGNNPLPDNRSTDTAISNLEVTDAVISAVAGFPYDFTATEASDVESVTISFDKPAGATATFRVGGIPNTSFSDQDQHCTITDVSLNVGPNSFTFTIISESGSSADYYLTVYRQTPGEIMVKSIDLDQTSTILKIGETTQIKATVLPEDATKKDVTWSSDKDSVAKVVDNTIGFITGVARGTATITATANDFSGIKGTATVTVVSTDTAISNLIVNGADISNSSPKYSATVTYETPSVTISFNKPLGATAVFLAGTTTVQTFGNKETQACQVTAAQVLDVGSNSFTIKVTSESGDDVNYTLVITRSIASTQAVVITLTPVSGGAQVINENENAVQASQSVLAKTGQTEYAIQILDTVPGSSFTWRLDGVVDTGTTGRTYYFIVKGRQNGSYIISVDAGAYGSDYIQINVTD